MKALRPELLKSTCCALTKCCGMGCDGLIRIDAPLCTDAAPGTSRGGTLLKHDMLLCRLLMAPPVEGIHEDFQRSEKGLSRRQSFALKETLRER